MCKCKYIYFYIYITYTSTEACNIIHMYWKHLCKLSIYTPHIVYVAYSGRVWYNLDTNQIPILTTHDVCLQGFQVLPAFVDTIHSSLKGKEIVKQRWQRRVHSNKKSLKALMFQFVSVTGQVGGFEPVEKYAQPKWDHLPMDILVSLFSMENKCVFEIGESS